MRRILVKYLVGHRYTKVFGKTVYWLRAADILFPAIVFVGLAYTGDPRTWDFHWYDVLLLGGLGLLFWLGLGNFKWTYFGMWPASYSELEDNDQKMDFLTAVSLLQAYNPWLGDKVYGPLPHFVMEEYKRLLWEHEKEMSGQFVGLKKFIPLLVALAAIIGYYLYWNARI